MFAFLCPGFWRSCCAAVSIALLPCAVKAQSPRAPLIELAAGNRPSAPLEPYISYLLAAQEQSGVLQGLRFPLQSSLQRGVLPTEGIQALDGQWLTQNIFIIAADAHSLAWLAFNHEALRKMQAWGLVVHAQDAAQFKAAQEAANPIPLAPATGGWLEQQLRQAGAGIYPVLIRRDGTVHQILGDKAW